MNRAGEASARFTHSDLTLQRRNPSVRRAVAMRWVCGASRRHPVVKSAHGGSGGGGRSRRRCLSPASSWRPPETYSDTQAGEDVLYPTAILVGDHVKLRPTG